MRIGRVIGSGVATIKVDNLRGSKLLIVMPVSVTGEPKGDPVVAVDAIGAGEGDRVLICEGSSAQRTDQTEGAPVDAVIMAILDSLEVEGTTTYSSS